MITNELIRLKAVKYKGMTGERLEKDLIFGTGAISYIEEADDNYIVHLIGDGTLYYIVDKDSIEKLRNLIKSNVM